MTRLGLLAVVLFAATPTAYAQTPPEPIDPDRPDVTNGTHIVKTGLVQVEVGGIYTSNGPADHSAGTPLTVRFGVFDWLEGRIGTDGVITLATAGAQATGLGNLQMGAKLRLWADPGGVPVLSILPTVNLPTASSENGLGSGDTDYAVAVLTGSDFATSGHVDFNYGIGLIGAGNGRPHFTQHLVSISTSYAASAHWNPYVEMFWFSKQEADSGAAGSADAGAIYLVTPRFAIDGGIQFGLTRAAANFGAFGGVSIVVGGDGVRGRQRDRKPKTKPTRAAR